MPVRIPWPCSLWDDSMTVVPSRRMVTQQFGLNVAACCCAVGASADCSKVAVVGLAEMPGRSIVRPESKTIRHVRGFRLCALRELDLGTDDLIDVLEQESGRHAGAGQVRPSGRDGCGRSPDPTRA